MIGDFIKSQTGIIPAAQNASTVNGPAVDRSSAHSLTVYAMTGAETGAPSARTAALKLQDSADGSTGWADIAGGAVPNITAVNSAAELDVPEMVNVKRFVRVVSVVSFTGGASPTLQVAAAVVLGDYNQLPA